MSHADPEGLGTRRAAALLEYWGLRARVHEERTWFIDLALAEGAWERDARLLGASMAVQRTRLSQRHETRALDVYEPYRARIAEVLGAEAGADLWRQGGDLPLERAVALAVEA